MALRIGNPASRREHILVEDRESAAPTVFTLRRLTNEELANVMAMSPLPLLVAMEISAINARAKAEERDLTGFEKDRIDEILPADMRYQTETMKQMRQAALLGVVEVKGVIDETGAEIAVTPKQFVEGCTRFDWINELGQAVLDFSTLKEEDRKN